MSHAELLALFIRTTLDHQDVGTNEVNRGQCTGLAALWCEQCSKPAIFADGKDYLTVADPVVYTVVHNQPLNYPHAGDLICWDGSLGDGHGHVAIVVAANVRQVAVFEQNNPDGAAPTIATHDYTAVLGWLTWK